MSRPGTKAHHGSRKTQWSKDDCQSSPRINYFGEPDGTKADPKENEHDQLIYFPPSYGDLAVSENDHNIRIFAGPKGSGKTRYMRSMYIALKDKGEPTGRGSHRRKKDVFVAHRITTARDLPSSEQVRKFSLLFATDLEEAWRKLWHYAIIRSLLSYFLTDGGLGVNPKQKEELRDLAFRTLYHHEFLGPQTVPSQALDIINSFHQAHEFRTYFDNPAWRTLEDTMADIIPSLPPMWFFLDELDEFYEYSPRYWLRCQQGLFYAIIDLYRSIPRVHVVITLRDNVLSAIYHTEQANKYTQSSPLVNLKWNEHAISYLLEKKIEDLPHQLWADPDGDDWITRWLGFKTIEARNLDEDVRQYLLRHSRMLPRDIVILGNSICKAMVQQSVPGPLPPDVFRRCVSEAARTFGDEQLTICANQIVAEAVPTDDQPSKNGEPEKHMKEYRDWVRARLKELIRGYSEKIHPEQLKEIAAKARAEFGENCDLLAVLWQNGLLGFRELLNGNERTIFYGMQGHPDLALPTHGVEYVFHSCLIDAIGLTPKGHPPKLF